MRDKFYANIGVERNKKPLQNILYKIEIIPESRLTDTSPENLEKIVKYKFKDEGYLMLRWGYQRESFLYWHGFITPENLKKKLGEKQWSKFCQGKKEFIIQRRANGRNIPKEHTSK